MDTEFALTPQQRRLTSLTLAGDPVAFVGRCKDVLTVELLTLGLLAPPVTDLPSLLELFTYYYPGESPWGVCPVTDDTQGLVPPYLVSRSQLPVKAACRAYDVRVAATVAQILNTLEERAASD
jgi:hypothetical protein